MKTNYPPDAVNFYNSDVDFQLPYESALLRSWLIEIIHAESRSIQNLSFIFCSDDYLHQINLQYLNHDTLADIITFPYSNSHHLHGDIFISIERIKENASQFEATFDEELLRVISHGVYHLCGYNDKDMQQKEIMRSKENQAIDLFSKYN